MHIDVFLKKGTKLEAQRDSLQNFDTVRLAFEESNGGESRITFFTDKEDTGPLLHGLYEGGFSPTLFMHREALVGLIELTKEAQKQYHAGRIAGPLIAEIIALLNKTWTEDPFCVGCGETANITVEHPFCSECFESEEVQWSAC